LRWRVFYRYAIFFALSVGWSFHFASWFAQDLGINRSTPLDQLSTSIRSRTLWSTSLLKFSSFTSCPLASQVSLVLEMKNCLIHFSAETLVDLLAHNRKKIAAVSLTIKWIPLTSHSPCTWATI
jgi:hypothetical protein